MMNRNEAQAIEMWPIERLIPYVRNARVCPESAITKVAGSIHEFGFKSPILVDGEGVVIAGHTRLLAAQRLGLGQVPVIVCGDLSAAQVKALRLADNRTAAETSWDEEPCRSSSPSCSSWAPTSLCWASMRRSSPACSPRRRTPASPTPTRYPSHLSGRSAGWATSGRSGPTACSAATPRIETTSRA